ncbi:transcriptional regulator [Niallia oryzisoli]|uniref:transcriptional regulator n=1 Tax=Niallia oryzisoli TaxID=1737571 RepID=UPI00373680CF
MDKIVLEEDIVVYCITATSFPEGVLAAHQKLHAVFPVGERRFFGISRPENGVIVYKAAAEVLEKDKVEQFNYETLMIKKGNYRCMTILNFMEDEQRIGKAFGELISSPDIDRDGYCIEYYYNDKDVKCMVRLQDHDLQER